MDFLSNVKARISTMMGGKEPEALDEGGEQEYVELDTASADTRSKVVVRPFVMNDFEDVKAVIDSLRDGNTIALVNIKSLKDKNIDEAKRAITKLKKTTDALSGDLKGFDSDYLIVTPSFATIYRAKPAAHRPDTAARVTEVADTTVSAGHVSATRPKEETF